MGTLNVPQYFMPSHPLPFAAELHATARHIAWEGKGLLAADESLGSIKKRFESVGMENTEENRRAWRDLLLSSPDIDKYLSGVIMFEETLMKHGSEMGEWKGKPFIRVLLDREILPGVKTDMGLQPLPRTEPEETTTQGLDNLKARSRAYYERGARFTKWRAQYVISDTTPTELAREDNAEVLGRFAAISQSEGLVPIVEPELLMTGDYTLARSVEAHIASYAMVIKKLELNKVDFAGCVLKASFVMPGDRNAEATTVTEQAVAEATLHVLSKVVPPAIPCVVFLSGGLTDAKALWYLNAVNVLASQDRRKYPWNLSFSYGRALQGAAMKKWAKGDWKGAQARFVQMARWCSEAARGQYRGGADELQD